MFNEKTLHRGAAGIMRSRATSPEPQECVPLLDCQTIDGDIALYSLFLTAGALLVLKPPTEPRGSRLLARLVRGSAMDDVIEQLKLLSVDYAKTMTRAQRRTGLSTPTIDGRNQRRLGLVPRRQQRRQRKNRSAERRLAPFPDGKVNRQTDDALPESPAQGHLEDDPNDPQ